MLFEEARSGDQIKADIIGWTGRAMMFFQEYEEYESTLLTCENLKVYL